MNLAIKLSKLNLELSKQEALEVLKNPKHKLENNLLIIKTKNVNWAIKQLQKTAFSKEAYHLNKIPKKGTYKITKVKITKTPNIKEVGKIFSHLKANLKNPKHEICLIGSTNTYIGLKVFENKERFEDRKSHKRPINHPTSIDPKLARAMINLANSNKITDPFCGAGGIIIEGALINKEMTGIEISDKMLSACKRNLEFFNLEANLVLSDATKLSISQPIVTDIPYGKNSHKSKETTDLLNWVFKQKSKKIIICTNTPPLKKRGWTKKNSFKIYVHKSMTRYITHYHKSSILA
ncbi:MAG: TRM11 family SAM-dependent methyltransferase [Candidatus Woesearchaeota archaeon]